VEEFPEGTQFSEVGNTTGMGISVDFHKGLMEERPSCNHLRPGPQTHNISRRCTFFHQLLVIFVPWRRCDNKAPLVTPEVQKKSFRLLVHEGPDTHIIENLIALVNIVKVTDAQVIE
jgi:hypothetical protein